MWRKSGSSFALTASAPMRARREALNGYICVCVCVWKSVPSNSTE
jgi:hypothetical protein